MEDGGLLVVALLLERALARIMEERCCCWLRIVQRVPRLPPDRTAVIMGDIMMNVLIVVM